MCGCVSACDAKKEKKKKKFLKLTNIVEGENASWRRIKGEIDTLQELLINYYIE